MMNPGEHLMIGVEGTVMTQETGRLLKNTGCSGVIIFSRNYENPKQIKKFIEDMNFSAGKQLIIGVDQEGGRVARFPEPFTKFPPMAEFGCAPDGEEKARAAGKTLGRELCAVGINIDFAPVLDVATNAFNPVIGDRAFSSDAERVAELGVAFINGIQSEGVAACGKHFPGHGDTNVDSHLGLPLLHHTRKRFDACELIPFKKAIAAKTAAIMTAHLMIPNLDPDSPATISRAITTDILRNELGFNGIVFTDDLTMKGMLSFYPPEGSAWRAIAAGADIAMICRWADAAMAARETLDRAAGEGWIDELVLERSSERVRGFLKMESKMGLARISHQFP